MGTTFTRTAEISRKWYLVDAKDKTVGRLATSLAQILIGKHKVNYTPSLDNGDYVVVINADKVRFSGHKWESKSYYWHTGHMGGIKKRSAGEMLSRKPTEILRKAVWGMLSKSDLSRRQLMKLKLYASPDHPHQKKKLEILEL